MSASTNVSTKERCILSLNTGDEFVRYGIELTDRWGNVSRVEDITTDINFFKSIFETIAHSDLSALHLRDVIEDLVVIQYT